MSKARCIGVDKERTGDFVYFETDINSYSLEYGGNYGFTYEMINLWLNRLFVVDFHDSKYFDVKILGLRNNKWRELIDLLDEVKIESGDKLAALFENKLYILEDTEVIGYQKMPINFKTWDANSKNYDYNGDRHPMENKDLQKLFSEEGAIYLLDENKKIRELALRREKYKAQAEAYKNKK